MAYRNREDTKSDIKNTSNTKSAVILAQRKWLQSCVIQSDQDKIFRTAFYKLHLFFRTLLSLNESIFIIFRVYKKANFEC